MGLFWGYISSIGGILGLCWGYITGLYEVCIGIMEKKMGTTI